MPKRAREEAKQAARLAAHWRTRAAEFRRLAHGPEASQYRRAAEQAEAIAKSFVREAGREEQNRAEHFSTDFCVLDDGEPVIAQISGKPVEPRAFPRRHGKKIILTQHRAEGSGPPLHGCANAPT